jgi:hypothetical protein
MTEIANVTKTIAAPGDRVWTALRSIGGLDRWFPIIETCRVEGQGVGAIRILGLVGGGEMRDRIVEISDVDRRLRYDRYESPIPVEEYLGTVVVEGAGGNFSKVSWTVKMETSPEKEEQLQAVLAGVFRTNSLTAAIEGALSDGIDGLERDINSAGAVQA